MKLGKRNLENIYLQKMTRTDEDESELMTVLM